MEKKELLKSLENKLKEIDNIRNLNSKDLRFKSWHVSTLSVLKHLSANHTKEANLFKKLNFTDTKYHRGSGVFNPSDARKYKEDLDAAEKILRSILPAKKTANSRKKSASKNSTKK